MIKQLIYILILPFLFTFCDTKEKSVQSITGVNCDDLQLDILYNHYFISDRKSPYTGICYKLNKNSDTIETKNHIKGKIEGVLTKYFESGQILSETNFKKNKYHGNYKEWDEKGNLVFHGIYENGKFDSILIDNR